MSPPKSETAPPARRTPRNFTARGRWGEEQLLRSEKSQLITVDLAKLLAKPEAWNCLEEDEKREILAWLPDEAHPDLNPSHDDPDAKIPPPPQSFLRYSNFWRDGIRQFQVDLQNGRYNREWLRQAKEAMQQRPNGDFDSFKDREYEEFWGQKQKIDMREIAGESATVKLATLIKEGLVHRGDVWRFTRVFLNDGEKIPVDKEARVLEIHGAKLKFAIPSGQRVFLSSIQHASQTSATYEGKETAEAVEVMKEEVTSTPSDEKDEDNIPRVVIINQNVDDTKPTAGEGLKRASAEPEHQPPVKRKRGQRGKLPLPPEPFCKDKIVSELPPTKEQESCTAATLDVLVDTKPASLETSELPTPHDETNPRAKLGSIDQNESEIPSSTPPQSQNGPDLSTSPAPPVNESREIIIDNIVSPSMFAAKIIQVDGRVGHYHNANPWKEIRCYRNNQDMGSLWDVRQAWFLEQI